MTPTAAARLNMVDSQIRPNKVGDPRLLDSFLTVPRESFVPASLAGVAYVDTDVPLGNGRFLMEPMILARLLQAAEAGPDDTALDVGGSGYAGAILASLAAQVVVLEEDATIARRALSALAPLGVTNVTVREGRLARGYPERAPYDVIVLGGAVADFPPALVAQLAEGGRLVGVIKGKSGLGQGVLGLKTNGALARRPLFDAGTEFLPGLAPEPSFVF